MPSVMIFGVTALIGGMIGRFLTLCIHSVPNHRPILAPLPAGHRHVAVELLTAVGCAGALWYYGPTMLLASRVVFGCALIVLFAIDLEHRLLPNVITLPGIVIGFLFSLVTAQGWQSSLLGIAIGGGLSFAVAEIYYRIRGREGLGMGDVKMLAMIGAFLGWQGAIVTLMIGSIAGSIVGLLVIALRRGDLQYALPFGTFLAVGAAVSEIVVQPLLGWLLNASAGK